MCGIFGIATKRDSGFPSELLRKSSDRLFRLSESRGKEASGLALFYNGNIKVHKSPLPASALIKSKGYKEFFEGLNVSSTALIGHARLVTNGAMEDNANNQPVSKEGIVGVHNGIIVNDKEIWQAFSQLKKEYEVDTEALLALVRMFLNQKKPLIEAVQNSFSIIRGAASVGILFEGENQLVLATNTGSLYTCLGKAKEALFFASELFILKEFLKWRKLQKIIGDCAISQVKAKNGLVVDIPTLSLTAFALEKSEFNSIAERTVVPKTAEVVRLSVPPHLIVNRTKQVAALKRCSYCVLPETMPLIEFDENGVCNYCRDYKKVEIKGAPALEKVLAAYRSDKGEPDVLVPLSGGRDSSFTLHYAKNVLGLNPIAYSYDWGMLTDLARRNQSRMCGELGVEHILVSADIRKKRENIRKNVLAWLKKPDLGTVPLFMIGDKQYFYYLDRLKRQTGIKAILFGYNPYEKTDFKYGFAGIKEGDARKKKTRHVLISNVGKFRATLYYLNQFLHNPAYLNSSLWDTLSAYLAYYFTPHNYLLFYQYKQWDENEVVSTIIGKYNWELSEDTKDTWRIGDGTAAIYNYIYYLVAGFTENDTFRSNQIREGVLNRSDALKLIEESNQPRYESIKWYCDTICVDFEKTLSAINLIPPLYSVVWRS